MRKPLFSSPEEVRKEMQEYLWKRLLDLPRKGFGTVADASWHLTAKKSYSPRLEYVHKLELIPGYKGVADEIQIIFQNLRNYENRDLPF